MPLKYNIERLKKLKSALSELETIDLAKLPTPLHEVPNLSKNLRGPRIFFKREDLTGLAFGGNKTRMFEYSLAKVLNAGYDTIIAGAAVQSNYCRQLAAACAKIGLELHLILRKVRGEKDLAIQGNLLLDLMTGAKVEILEETSEEIQKQAAFDLAEELKREGKKPYIARSINQEDIGYDASAYVNCMVEIVEQMEQQDIDVDSIYLAALDTTHAGLIFGAEYMEMEVDIVAFNPMDPSFFDLDPIETVLEINENLSEILDIDFTIGPERIISISDYVGEGYGIATELGIEAIKLVAETEGIILDPVYTGKAMSGLIDHIKKNKLTRDDTVMFVHTGGNPAIFAYTEELQLYI